MLRDAADFAEALRPLIEKLVKEQTQNVLRANRFDVVTPADGSKMGVRQPYGDRQIFLPYTQEVANAKEGDAVLVLWRGSLSNGKVWCFGNGPELVNCPKLKESQKSEILSLVSAYEAEKSNTVYYFNATHNSYASRETAYDGNGKLRLCCTTFAEMIWGGVSPETFFDNPSAYAGNIVKAFDWGYFNPYTVRQRAARLANRSGSTVTGLYGFTSPDGTDETAFSYNTRYDANGDLQNSQTWLGFLNAADFASELSVNGYEIPASKADVGDLVFYDAAPYAVNAMYNVSFRRISHVAVITAKINGFFEVVEATSADNGNGPLIRRSIFSSDDFCCAKSGFMQSRAVMFARHPSAYGVVGNVPEKFSLIPTRV